MATLPTRADDAHPRTRTAAAADAVSYWLIMSGTYLTVGFLFYYSAKRVLFDQAGTMPSGLAAQYKGSFIASFPGVNVAWSLIGLVMLVVFLGVVASLLAGEFLPWRRKPILLASLGLSMFAYGLMVFAENMIANTDSVNSLFGYFSGTAVVIILLLVMPPYRDAAWLSSLASRNEAPSP
jgi:ribose/xylose/arabinose/galactoside ABC-type transport system permease subunit